MTDGTDNNSVLRKLVRKPAAVVALAIITCSCLIAIFAYILAPDNTPYANRMIIELGAKQPGFTKQLLFLPKTIRQQKAENISGWFRGKPSDYIAIPINGYWFDNNNTLFAKHYIDEGLKDTLRYKLSDVLPVQQLSKTTVEQQQYIRSHLIITRKFYLGTDRYGRDIL